MASTDASIAFEIAHAFGWVSLHRLRNQSGMSRGDALAALVEARRNGWLSRMPDGRYYAVPDSYPGT